MKRAIKNHATDFAAIIVLLVLAVVSSGYILHKEGLRFPLINSGPETIYAQLSTAQAVTPGQGQTVRISGVQVGSISGVQIKNGTAMVELKINQQYKDLVHTNATALLRPRTGLDDMFLELNPGSSPAPVVKPGFVIPVSQTNPDVNPDEILGSLDADTRGYLQLLINGAGAGLQGHGGSEIAQILKRFEPTHRDLARLNSAVAVRGADLRQLVNSLQRLNTALVTKRSQIVSLVDSSAHVFRAFASEQGNISRALVDLPGTLSQTTATLEKVQTFAKVLGPTSTNLLPAARSIPAANAALTALAKPSTPIIQNQIRPFVIASRPLVRQLRPASINLAKGTPGLTRTIALVNHLFNMLAYEPTGVDQHPYLWWLAWLDHNARTLFSIQDANGDFRPLFLQASCASLNQIAQGVSGSSLLLNLTPLIGATGVCSSTGSHALPLAKQGAVSATSSGATSTSTTSSSSSGGSATSAQPAGTSSTATSAAPAGSATTSGASTTSSSLTTTAPSQLAKALSGATAHKP
jgi:phospholipid/cholesterol/gamma-HCH transport system substrate-binding protein